MRYFYLFLICTCPPFAGAREIRFPDEELAPESVLPVFESHKNVTMNRRVQLKNKLGLRSSFLGRMDEPFLHPVTFAGGLEFFFNETHGVRLSSIYFWPGLSHVGSQVFKETPLDPGKIHHPQFGFFLSYSLTPFYGKISLATNVVTNLNLSVYAGLGALVIDVDALYNPDLRWTYAGWLEFNQKVFIGQRFYIHGSLSFLIYHAPNPVWCSDPKRVRRDSCDFYKNQRDVMSYKDAEKSILFRTVVGGGAGVLLF